jgi:hypothetical protein
LVTASIQDSGFRSRCRRGGACPRLSALPVPAGARSGSAAPTRGKPASEGQRVAGRRNSCFQPKERCQA